MRKSKVYLHPFAGEPFGISTVEAMSAGLIPVVPDEGGYTEFVPEYYQFHTHQQAADIIGKILIRQNNNMQTERAQLSESVSIFKRKIPGGIAEGNRITIAIQYVNSLILQLTLATSILSKFISIR